MLHFNLRRPLSVARSVLTFGRGPQPTVCGDSGDHTPAGWQAAGLSNGRIAPTPAPGSSNDAFGAKPKRHTASASANGNARLLFIDDEVRAGDGILGVLAQAGFSVDLAQSGAAGLSAASVGRYQAIILDLRLPDVDGLDVLRNLTEAYPRVPVIVITGWYLELDIETRTRSFGAARLFYKPLAGDALVTELMGAITDPSLSIPVTEGQSDSVEGSLREVLDRLPRKLSRRFPHLTHDLLVSAAEDALLEHLRRPERFDASRGSLDQFLFLPAYRNVLNTLRSERRRLNREQEYAARNAEQVESPDTFELQLDLERLRSWALRTAPPAERAAIRSLFDGGTDEELADLLGVPQLAPEERRREVKRFKDRVKRRIVRTFQSTA